MSLVSRRRALAGSGALALLAAVPLQDGALRRLARLVPSEQARSLGMLAAGVQARGLEARAARALGASLSPAAALLELAREDFARGDTVRLAGLTLARSEAVVLRLAAA